MLPELFKQVKLKLGDELPVMRDVLITATEPEATPESTIWGPLPLFEMEVKKDKRGRPYCIDQGKRVKCPTRGDEEKAKPAAGGKEAETEKPAAKAAAEPKGRVKYAQASPGKTSAGMTAAVNALRTGKGLDKLKALIAGAKASQLTQTDSDRMTAIMMAAGIKLGKYRHTGSPRVKRDFMLKQIAKLEKKFAAGDAAGEASFRKVPAEKKPGKREQAKADKAKAAGETAKKLDAVAFRLGKVNDGEALKPGEMKELVGGLDRAGAIHVLGKLGMSTDSLKGKRLETLKLQIAAKVTADHYSHWMANSKTGEGGDKWYKSKSKPERDKEILARAKQELSGGGGSELQMMRAPGPGKKPAAKPAAAKPAAAKPAAPAAAAKKPADMSRDELLKMVQADTSISPAEKREMMGDDTDSLRNFFKQKAAKEQKAAKTEKAKAEKNKKQDAKTGEKAIGDVISKAASSGGDFSATMDAADDAIKNLADDAKLSLATKFAGEKITDMDDAEAAIRSHIVQQVRGAKKKAPSAAAKPAAAKPAAPAKAAPAKKSPFDGGDWAPIKPLAKKSRK